MLDCTIYVITHKKTVIPEINGYKPLLVGADKNDNFMNDYLKDNTGEHISEKNNSYCELTGLYWIWRNTNDAYSGLVHYRRYFAFVRKKFIYRGRFIVKSTENAYKILDKNDISKLLNGYDMLVKQKDWRLRNNRYIFTIVLGKECINWIEQTIFRNYADYYDLLKKIEKKHTHLNCNMFIGKKEIVDKYCEWLFSVLEDIDQLHIKKYGERYCNREMGYIGELLFEVWLKRNNIKYRIVSVVNTEDKTALNGVMDCKEFMEFFFSKILYKLRKT